MSWDWWEGVKATFRVLPRLADTAPYVRIEELEASLDRERERRREAEDEIRRRDRTDRISERLVAEGQFYYLPDEDGEREGPFCTRCWDVDDTLVRIHRFKKRSRWRCPNCWTLRAKGGS